MGGRSRQRRPGRDLCPRRRGGEARLHRVRAVAARAGRESHARRLAAGPRTSCRWRSPPRSSPGSAPRSAATREHRRHGRCGAAARRRAPVPAAVLRVCAGAPRRLRAARARALGALAGAAAWAAAERLLPKLLDDTLGHGAVSVTYPAPGRRRRWRGEFLTVALLLANEALAAAVARRSEGVRSVARPLAVAALMPLLLAAYGLAALAVRPTPAGKPLRMGLVQWNVVDYERLRREQRCRRGRPRGARRALRDDVRRRRAPARARGDVVGDRLPHDLRAPQERSRRRVRPRDPRHRRRAGCRSSSGPTSATPPANTTRPPSSRPGTGLLGFYRKTARSR